MLLVLALAGCHAGAERTVAKPTRHSLRSDQLLVLSDFKLPRDHTLIKDLVLLRGQVSEALALPLQAEPVVVYLFDDEMRYHQYLQTAHPGLPSRRAYFIGTPQELAVYTFWGDRIQEDLRHEYTHGLLHASMDTVPLWLDEGLAEYFEVAGPQPGGVNPQYVTRLSEAIGNGWRPDMTRLERLEKVDQMHLADYREAWAWTHFLLHSTPDTRQVLLGYLADLRTNPNPEALSKRLARETPEADARFLSYISTLRSLPTQVGTSRAAG